MKLHGAMHMLTLLPPSALLSMSFTGCHTIKMKKGPLVTTQAHAEVCKQWHSCHMGSSNLEPSPSNWNLLLQLQSQVNRIDVQPLQAHFARCEIDTILKAPMPGIPTFSVQQLSVEQIDKYEHSESADIAARYRSCCLNAALSAVL